MHRSLGNRRVLGMLVCRYEKRGEGKERERKERKVRIGKCGSEADVALGGMTPGTCVCVIW